MLRKNAGITQVELGKAVGLTQIAISDIERGKKLTSVEVLAKIADYFAVSVDFLLGRSDDPAPPIPASSPIDRSDSREQPGSFDNIQLLKNIGGPPCPNR